VSEAPASEGKSATGPTTVFRTFLLVTAPQACHFIVDPPLHLRGREQPCLLRPRGSHRSISMKIALSLASVIAAKSALTLSSLRCRGDGEMRGWGEEKGR
jgi:hypothetical protein